MISKRLVVKTLFACLYQKKKREADRRRMHMCHTTDLPSRFLYGYPFLTCGVSSGIPRCGATPSSGFTGWPQGRQLQYFLRAQKASVVGASLRVCRFFSANFLPVLSVYSVIALITITTTMDFFRWFATTLWMLSFSTKKLRQRCASNMRMGKPAIIEAREC